MKLVLEYALSMNSATKVLDLMFELKRRPSINTGKMWMLKVGYFNLMQKKEEAKDWIWIIDHSIQIGKEKCLVILAIRAINLPKTRALKYEDMDIIELKPVEKSTGEIVYEQLEKAKGKTGTPRVIVSDMGSDIKCGIRKFKEKNQETVHIYDLKHKIALLVRDILESDESWSQFRKLSNTLIRKLQNTTFAGYRPPRQREKARYMNIEPLVRWGKSILVKKEILGKIEKKNDDELKLSILLEDVSKFEEDIKVWDEMVRFISLIERFMNIHYFQNNSYEKFLELHSDKLEKIETNRAKLLASQILNFIKEQQEVCKKDERLLHSSEILESLFGKFKFLEKEQSKSSFTNLLLSIGAMVSKTTQSTILTALETVTIPMIDAWSKSKIGITIQAQKKELYSHI